MKYELSKQAPLASGGEKLVFQHPDAEDLLIKVWRSRYLDELKKKHPIVSSYMRTPKYSALLNEIVEHIAIREQNIESGYLQTIHGLVDTDIGLGMVVAAIRGKDKTLAKSLSQIIKEGFFTQRHRHALEALTDWLCESHVIVRDFTLNNVVWDELSDRFVIIDGIGSRPVPSLRMFSPKYNRYSMRKKVQKFWRRLESALKEEG